MLADEDLVNDICDHLQELGKFITADKLVDYLSREDVMEKHGLDKKITVHMAQRYLNELRYRRKVNTYLQYCNGHERDDVVYYREEVYLPTLKGFQDRSCIFAADGSVITPTLPAGVRRIVIWYHDKSIFYAHDCRRNPGTTKTPMPSHTKRVNGTSYMVADYFSTDFDRLRTRDGQPGMQRSM
ncbi:hypothetical protein B0H10DRAFT_1789755 [Mycena sp. CBHHK59/15]|nr:hypothetical protein B0H10DRAFT_1789755 [Mycena sp. CBHHK59/15]